MLILYIIVTAVQASGGIYGQDVNAVCSIFMIVLIGVVILEVGKLTILFNDDAVNSAKDEHSRIKEILDNIIMDQVLSAMKLRRVISLSMNSLIQLIQ